MYDIYGDMSYPEETPEVLHGLRLAVPLRKGWQLSTGPAFIVDIPDLPDEDKMLEAAMNGDIDDMWTKVTIEEEKLSYSGWTIAYEAIKCVPRRSRLTRAASACRLPASLRNSARRKTTSAWARRSEAS